MGIGNIHVMRNSQKKIATAIDNGNWEASVNSSNWLHHVRLVVSSSCRVAANIASGQSVLVHCSDGKFEVFEVFEVFAVFAVFVIL